LEDSDYQDHNGGQDPYDEAMKLLATASDDEPIDGGLKEDSDVISTPLSYENDRSQSQLLLALASQESVPAIDSQSITLTLAALTKSALGGPGQPP
jgi:hypothetical protein